MPDAIIEVMRLAASRDDLQPTNEEMQAALRAALEAAKQRADKINTDDDGTVLECLEIAAYGPGSE